MDHIEAVYLTKHRQIIEAVTREITEGRLKPYDRLPSEKELCEQWQASRSTVRKAMDSSRTGSRSFVSRERAGSSLSEDIHQPSQISNFADSMKAQGFDVQTRHILKEVIEPSEEIAAFLKLMQGSWF